MKMWVTVCLLGGILITVTVAGALKPDLIPGLNMILLAGLICVTAFYAIRTAEIAKATKQQADASVKMAEEMREQWQSEARPYLLLRLQDGSVSWNPELGMPVDSHFTVTIVNAGKGPAVNLFAAFWFPKGKTPFMDGRGYLVSGEEWKARINGLPMLVPGLEKEKTYWLPELRELVEHHKPGVVAVEYKDVHKRKWASYLCLDSPVNDATVAIDGEQGIVELNQND